MSDGIRSENVISRVKYYTCVEFKSELSWYLTVSSYFSCYVLTLVGFHWCVLIASPLVSPIIILKSVHSPRMAFFHCLIPYVPSTSFGRLQTGDL